MSLLVERGPTLRWLLSATYCCLLAATSIGCRVGPDYCPPTANVPHHWSQQQHPILQGQPINPQAWWTHFEDPVLDQLVFRSLSSNLTLRQAAHRILEARARRRVAVGNLFPQSQSLEAGFSSARISSTTANFFSVPGFFSPELTTENWATGLAASWELDFWGRYRRAVEAADASLDSTVAAYDDATVILLSEVAQTYIEIRTLEARLNLARTNLQVQEKTLQIAMRKKESGLATAIDIGQAELNYGQTAAILPQLETVRRQANHRLCVLMGAAPAELTPHIGYTGRIPMPANELALDVPADLVRRRPDVRFAERALAEQSARIGIAQSDFYPHVTLTGNIGLQSEDFGKLYRGGSQVGLLAPQLSWKILNYGRIQANVTAEEVALKRLHVAYSQAVLTALQEAEDAQVAYVLGHDRVQALAVAVSGAQKAVSKITEVSEAGAVDFGRVYVLQGELLRQQDELAAAQGDICLNLVSLFEAMGGGWSANRSEQMICASTPH